jgi:hypothetical protein
MWVNPTSASVFRFLYEGRLAAEGAFPTIYINSSNQLIYRVNSADQITGGTISTATWTHIAVCRSGTSTKLFISGTQSGSTYTDTTVYLNNPLRPVIGINLTAFYFYNGYIDDLRVTKGIARYTTTFTPPTAAFPNQAPTYPSGTATQRAMFAFGTGGPTSIVNLVSNIGVVAGDTSTVATARLGQAGAGYGGDKAIFAYGYTTGVVSLSNLVSNTGVVAADTTGVGTARYILNAASYGVGKAIFAYGYTSTQVSISNLVSSAGVIATDTTGVGTTRSQLSSASYGTDKAIFAYGWTGGAGITAISNLVSNTGVVGNDVTGVGSARLGPAGASYGGDKAIIGYGNASALVNAPVSMTNLVSSTGVVATDTTGVGTARAYIAAASYGGDKAIFGYGYNGSDLSMSNLVSSTGVVATDTTGVGTARNTLYAANYSYS